MSAKRVRKGFTAESRMVTCEKQITNHENTPSTTLLTEMKQSDPPSPPKTNRETPRSADAPHYSSTIDIASIASIYRGGCNDNDAVLGGLQMKAGEEKRGGGRAHVGGASNEESGQVRSQCHARARTMVNPPPPRYLLISSLVMVLYHSPGIKPASLVFTQTTPLNRRSPRPICQPKNQHRFDLLSIHRFTLLLQSSTTTTRHQAMSFSAIPPEILSVICECIYDFSIPTNLSSLDPLVTSLDIAAPTGLPSSHPPAHWSEQLSRNTLSSLCLTSQVSMTQICSTFPPQICLV